MKLYYAPRSISVAVVIALHEAGLAYDGHALSLTAGEQSGPDYLGINPKGRVPALETDRGILTETGAILDYIAACAPNAHLVPDDPFLAAQMRMVMYYIASTLHVNHAHKMRGSRWADNPASFEDMAAKVPRTMADSCRYVENHCLKGPLVMGKTLTLADPYLFVTSTWFDGDGVDVSAYPRITAFRAAMEDRASVRAARSAGLL